MTVILKNTLSLEEIIINGNEKVLKVVDKTARLKAFICIHNSTLGAALGGTRIYPYPSEADALIDVLRLARGMTYKSAIAETGFGGGKSVIIADPQKDKSEALLLAFGTAVHALKGTYICAEDVGSSVEDMTVICKATPYVVGLSHEKSSGDPSLFTAWGTFRGIQSALKKIYRTDSLKDRTVAIQGLGNVGAKLAEFLFWAGAKLIVSDIDMQKAVFFAKRFGTEIRLPEEILSAECDIFSPCALGGVLNSQTIVKLNCKAVAGSANNQLLEDSDADFLFKRGILYAPDFVINSGGLINVATELEPEGYQACLARNKVDRIYDQLMIIYEIAEKNQYSTNKAAMNLANYRLTYGVGKRSIPIAFHHSNISI
ncbi:MAG: Glu/Leu/Phe/Val family dehydrogenase [Anaerolineae bacterium]